MPVSPCTVLAFVALLKLFGAFRLLTEPSYLAAVGPDQLHAQVQLLLSSFRHEWSLSLVLFGIHLCLLGYLVYRAGYIPRILGILLAVAGVGYVIYSLGPYLYPQADVDFLFITFLSEPIFTFWLLIRGWKIEEPAATVR